MSEAFAPVILVALGVLALFGAVDYIVESIRIFLRALKRYRDRH